MIAKYEDPESDNSLPVQASLLPIIAIIGRPNTGKSTIVNRLTDSFKGISFTPPFLIIQMFLERLQNDGCFIVGVIYLLLVLFT
jgi:hypothetical protein